MNCYNGTMDPDHFQASEWKRAVAKLVGTWDLAISHGGACSTWWGTLDDAHMPETILNKGPGYRRPRWWPGHIDRHIPWFTAWEYCYVLTRAHLMDSEPLTLLSLGGAASVLDLTLMRLGHHLTVLDARTYGVEQQQKNVEVLGIADRLDGRPGQRIETLGAIEKLFDGMISTNVLFLAGDPAQRACCEYLHRRLTPEGWACFTFDVGNPNPRRLVSDPVEHFRWNGMDIDGAWRDNGQRYHLYYPDPALGRYTAGGMLQRRRA